MYRIRRIQLVRCPPIGSLDAAIHDGLTTIVGRNGSGKSALALAIRNRRWPNGGRFQLWTEGTLEEHLEPMVFVDENLRSFWNVVDRLPDWCIKEVFTPAFADCMERTLSECLSANRHNPRFRDIIHSGPNTFRVKIASSENISVEAETVGGRCAIVFDERAAAMGERWFLSVASMLSLRRHLKLDIPFIADAIFGELDESWTELVCELLIRGTSQLLLFCSLGEWQRACRWLHPEKTIALPDPYGGTGLTA
jgi:hypothetical protein